MGTWANNQTFLEGVDMARLGLLSLCNCDCIVKKFFISDEGQPVFIIERPSLVQIAVLSVTDKVEKVTRGTKTYLQIDVRGCIACWDEAA